jgi:homocysteine S-methyltransferase
VDFLMAATLPAASEALGIALAMAGCGLPFFLSFVIRPSGALLDGTPLDEVIRHIDASVEPPPLGFWVNCVHPSVFESGMEQIASRSPGSVRRVTGLQGNTSTRSPEELEGCERLEREAPGDFARGMLSVRGRFGTLILGGCCGTDDRHIRAIAAGLIGA